MRSDNNTLQFPALTGIRAVAVYLVYLHHTNPFSAQRFGDFLHGVVREFHVGVSLFFVLSGFLITHRYYNNTALSLKVWMPYIKNRVARVYPMYWLMTTATFITFLVQHRAGASPWFTYLMNITFLRGFFDDLKFSLVGPGWSLTVEECFYFSAPFLFLVFRNSRLAGSLLPAFLIASGCLLVWAFGGAHHGFFRDYTFMFVYTFPGRCTEFFWGAALALFMMNRKKEARGAVHTWLGLAMMAAFVILLSGAGQADSSGIFSAPGIMINNFLFPASVALFYHGLMTEKTYLRQLLASRLLVTLGKSSYAFYLIHVGIIYEVVHTGLQAGYITTFLALNLVALLLWYMVEEPANRAIRSL